MFKWIKDLFGKQELNPPENPPPRPEPTPATITAPPEYKDWSRDTEVIDVKPAQPKIEWVASEFSSEAVFDEFYQGLRQHQKDALLEAGTEPIGQIILPTGCGKSLVQTAIHVDSMIDRTICWDGPGVYVIAAHRLLLCAQLLNTLVELAVKCRLNFNILVVGSDRVDEAEFHKKFYSQGLDKSKLEVISTTSSHEIQAFVKKSHEQGRNVICVSTYHSFHRLKGVEVDTATFDEAHVLVGSTENFLDNISVVSIDRKYFFTATRKVINEEFGMNDERIFGPVLFEVSPREMIDKGEIVPPKLHIIRPSEDGEWDNGGMIVKSITDGFTQHKELLYKYSANQHHISPKLLVTASGTLALMEIINSDVFCKYCYDNKIKVLAFSSVEGYFYQDLGDEKPSKVSRESLNQAMSALGPFHKAILIHVDILTEGIDLPGITGVMPFRELSKIKLLQTIGRAARLLPIDRTRLYQGVFQPSEREKYVKPFSWILIPEFFKTLGSSEQMISVLTTIFNNYGSPVEEYIVPDRYLSSKIPDLDNITTAEDLKKKFDECDLDHIIQAILMDKLELALHDEEFNKTLQEYVHGD